MVVVKTHLHAEAHIPDAESGAISEAIETRRAALTGKGAMEPPRPILALLGPPGVTGSLRIWRAALAKLK
jgi:hypothetical protein